MKGIKWCGDGELQSLCRAAREDLPQGVFNLRLEEERPALQGRKQAGGNRCQDADMMENQKDQRGVSVGEAGGQVLCLTQESGLGPKGALGSACSVTWRRQWHPTLVLLPGKSNGRRSLGRLQSIEVAKSRTRLSDFPFTFHFHALETEMATHSTVLDWTIPGTGEPGGLPSMGSHRVGHD